MKDPAAIYKMIERQINQDNNSIDYEKWIDSWSEPGHLYIHYKRPYASDAEYNKYAVWIWPNAPLDLEGSLWGASNPNVQDKFYEMSTSWMTNIGGKGIDKDNHGKILDIDLSREDIVGGESNKPVSFSLDISSELIILTCSAAAFSESGAVFIIGDMPEKCKKLGERRKLSKK